jgi:nicotinamidase-related amidase
MKKEKQKGLIIVDMINGFINEGVLADPYIDGITDEIVRLATAYITNGDKVIAFKDCHTNDSTEFESFPPHCVKGTSEAEMVDPLKKLESKMEVFEKNSTSGFMVPGFLEAIKGLDDIVITGCCTDICVMNLAIPLKNYFNQRNEKVTLTVPETAVETYNIPTVHERDEWNQMAFRFMKQAGIEIVKNLEVNKRKSIKDGLVKTSAVSKEVDGGETKVDKGGIMQ